MQGVGLLERQHQRVLHERGERVADQRAVRLDRVRELAGNGERAAWQRVSLWGQFFERHDALRSRDQTNAGTLLAHSYPQPGAVERFDSRGSAAQDWWRRGIRPRAIARPCRAAIAGAASRTVQRDPAA